MKKTGWREWLRPGSAKVLGRENTPSQTYMIAFGLIVAISLIFRFSTLTKDSFWIDEGLTWAIVHLPFKYLWTVPFDAHPPLYYSLQKVWQVFGESEFAMRSLPAILGLVLPVIVFRFIHRHLGFQSAALVACLILLSYTLIVHSSTIRSYTLLLVLGTAAMIELIELTTRTELNLKSEKFRRHCLLYVIFQTAALYTHLVAIVDAAALGASIVLVNFIMNKRLEPTLRVLAIVAALNAIVVALWAPWPLFMMASSDDFSWLRQASIGEAVKTFSETVGPNGFGKFGELPILLLIAAGLLFSVRRAPVPVLIFVVANLIAIPSAVYVTGFIKPIFMERTILQATLGTCTAIAVLVRCMPSTATRNGLSAALLLLYGASCVIYVTRSDQMKFHGDKLQLVENFRGVAASLADTGDRDAIVICREDQEIPTLYYYMRDHQPKDWLLFKDGSSYTVDAEHWINFKKIPTYDRKVDLITDPIPVTDITDSFDTLHLVISRGCLYTWQPTDEQILSYGYKFSREVPFAWVTMRTYTK